MDGPGRGCGVEDTGRGGASGVGVGVGGERGVNLRLADLSLPERCYVIAASPHRPDFVGHLSGSHHAVEPRKSWVTRRLTRVIRVAYATVQSRR